jgi:hypothetical protein
VAAAAAEAAAEAAYSQKKTGIFPYRQDVVNQRSVKELGRRTRRPFPVLVLEVEIVQMPDNAGHGDGAVAPGWTKVEVELIVLHILISRHRALA